MSFALLVVASSVSAAVVHPARQAHIDAVNAAATTWRAAAHPRFAAAPPGASAPMLGAKGDMKLEVAAAKARGDVVDYVPRGGAAPEAFALPIVAAGAPRDPLAAPLDRLVDALEAAPPAEAVALPQLLWHERPHWPDKLFFAAKGKDRVMRGDRDFKITPPRLDR